MTPTSFSRFYQRKPHNRTIPQFYLISFAALICFSAFTGCAEQKSAVPDKTSAESPRKKPEGLLLIARELDLGTLPVGGTMEAMIALKNPDAKKTYRINRYEISSPGFTVEPSNLEIAPDMTSPVSFLVKPEATKQKATVTCDVTAWDIDNQLLFRTTLRLKVK